jgi:hypothetical protein
MRRMSIHQASVNGDCDTIQEAIDHLYSHIEVDTVLIGKLIELKDKLYTLQKVLAQAGRADSPKLRQKLEKGYSSLG